MSLEVKYLDSPPGAQRDMRVDATSINAMSVVSRMATGERDGPWATLEPLGWPLNGSREILPDSPEVGFWSAETSENHAGILGLSKLGAFTLGKAETEGPFTIPPIIELSFSEKYTATGITFTFSPGTNEWCSKMVVQWYNENVLLKEVTVFPDSPRWTLVQMVDSFDKIVITILENNKGGHFAKVQMIEIGQTIIFGRDELTLVHLVNEIDPTLSTLSVDTMTIEIQDKHDRSIAPQEKQRMELHRVIDGKPELIAAHYITESSRQAKRSYRFSCQSAVGLLEDTYLGGMYQENDVMTVVADILDGRDFDLGPFINGKITGYLPVCTRREALQQVAFAIGAVISTQGTDIFKFTALPEGNPSGRFEKTDIFLGGKIATAPRIYKVEAVAHTYSQSGEEEILIDDEEFSGENILVTFNDPHYDYVITGGVLVESGVNYAVITADRNITLSAKTYIHQMTHRSVINTAATAAERNNVQVIEGATLVHNGNVNAVLSRILLFANMRQTLTQDAVIKGQSTGQKVTAVDPWGGQVEGYITAMESDLTQNGHTASVSIVGLRTETERV